MTEAIRFGTRLRAARHAAGFKTAKAFISRYHIPAATYSQHESGARLPDEIRMSWYSKILQINKEWLVTGVGAPYSRKGDAKQKLPLLNEKSYSIPSQVPINETLLHFILDKLSRLREKYPAQLPIKKIATLAVSLYVNATSTENSINHQIQFVKSALRVLEKSLQK